MSSEANIISVAYLGDVHIGENADYSIDDELSNILEKVDLTIANCESPLTVEPGVCDGKVILRSVPDGARLFKELGINAVALANNHIFDCGMKGYEDTVNSLEENGVMHFGAGKNISLASKPLTFEKSGSKVAFIACSSQKTESKNAGVNDHGCAPMDVKFISSTVKELKSEYDACIILPHWGLCDYPIPSPEQVQCAEEAIKAGALAVIGSHSHVVQGVQIIDNSLIAYSLGNFIFADYKHGTRTVKATSEAKRGMLLIVKLKAGKLLNWEVVHTINRGGCINVDKSKNREKTFKKRCDLLGKRNYYYHWRITILKRIVRRLIYWANPERWAKLRIWHFKGLWIMLRNIAVKNK